MMAEIRRLARLMVAVALGSGGLLGQSPNTTSGARPVTRTGAISGVVIDGTTNAPVAGAIVRLRPTDLAAPDQPFRQMTDARGRFLFRDLPPSDRYAVDASRPGYFDGSHGAADRGAPAAPLILGNDEWIRDANVVLFKSAAISGRVFDQQGEPVVQAYVRVLLRVPIGGREQLVTGPLALTDDRGAYRTAGLDAGRYDVQVPSVQHLMPIVQAPEGPPNRSIEASAGRPSTFGDKGVRIGNDLLIVTEYVPTLPPSSSRSRTVTRSCLAASRQPPASPLPSTSSSSFRPTVAAGGPDRAASDPSGRIRPAPTRSGTCRAASTSWPRLTT